MLIRSSREVDPVRTIPSRRCFRRKLLPSSYLPLNKRHASRFLCFPRSSANRVKCEEPVRRIPEEDRSLGRRWRPGPHLPHILADGRGAASSLFSTGCCWAKKLHIFGHIFSQTFLRRAQPVVLSVRTCVCALVFFPASALPLTMTQRSINMTQRSIDHDSALAPC